MSNQTTSPLDLTILILCLNEEESIAHCVGEARGFLERNAISGEVLVVDNGSTDRSATLAREAGARVVWVPDRGNGNAVMAGVEAAHGRFIILGDGDGEHDLGTLEPFWEKLQDGYDFVFGNRFSSECSPRRSGMSFLHCYVGNPLLSGIGKLLFRSSVSDFHCELRGFSADGVRALGLQCPGAECTSEMIVKATLKNMRIAEAPVMQRRAINPERVSRLRTWRDGWRHLRLLLMLSPRWTFLYPGCVIFAAGMLIMAVPILDPVEEGGRFGAYTMMFGSAFSVCGVQLIVFSLLASVFCENIGLTDDLGGRLTASLQKVRLLESGLASGLVLAVTGAAGSIWSLFVWAQTGGADIEARLRVAIPSLTLLIWGVQLMFSSFFLALLVAQGSVQSSARRRNNEGH